VLGRATHVPMRGWARQGRRRMLPKKCWARRLRRLAPIRSVDRSGPLAGPDQLHTLYTPENGEQTAGRSTERQPNSRTSRSAAVGLRLRRRRTAAPRCAGIRHAPMHFRPGMPSQHLAPPGAAWSSIPRASPCRRFHPVAGARAPYRNRKDMARKKCDDFAPSSFLWRSGPDRGRLTPVCESAYSLQRG
jgi:hypothetical protein